MVFMGHVIELDDISKAHMSVKTEVPSITSEQLYELVVQQSSIEDTNIKVTPSEIGDFMEDLSEEIKARKAFLNARQKMRKSDLAESVDELRRVNIVLLLPRTMSNQNINTVCNMLAFTVPLDIHFIIVLSDDTREKITEPLEKYTYWLLDLEAGVLKHK